MFALDRHQKSSDGGAIVVGDEQSGMSKTTTTAKNRTGCETFGEITF